MIRGARRYQVAIRFDREFGQSVADTLWHSTQRLEWKGDRALHFQCEVDGLEEIIWWVLAYGPHAEVLEPPELRSRVLSLTGQTIDQYRRSKRAAYASSKPPRIESKDTISAGTSS
jgi:predicted DNA-binding transcriptional regulator YafY